MRTVVAGFIATLALIVAAPAAAQSESPSPAVPAASDVDALEALHRDTIHTRRQLADSVLIAGLVSAAGGAALMIPSADDQAWRFAGVNTAIFGVVNTVVGLVALHGIANEERTWESDEARGARRTPSGLARAKIHAVDDERRESVGQAINLGLDCGYLGVAGTAILASQLGVEHPNRWLGSGVAIGVQALFLVGVDLVGLTRSRSYHHAFVETLMPNFAIVPTATGSELRFGFSGRF